MKYIICAIFITILSLASISTMAMENEATESSLERRISYLEKRVDALEAGSKNTLPSKDYRPATMGSWKDKKNWRQLKTGMSYDEVRDLLGEPENIDGGEVAYWYWGGRRAHVVFLSDKLSKWSEPQ